MHTKRILYLILVIMLVGLAGNHQSGSAQEPSQADPPQQEMEEALPAVYEEVAILVESLEEGEGMTVSDGCMQDIAGFGLNCTANDVQLAGVAYDESGDPLLEILDDGCAYPGDTVDFTATFEVVLTAQERHDIGIYFATDGDPNFDGAISGDCSISTVPYKPEPDWLDLDGTNDPNPGDNKPSGLQDLCGDIDDNHNPLYPTITLEGVACTDPDGDGFLNLPNCTSWRQPGANELCTTPLDAYPGAPSKCRCDDGFNVPIEVPAAELIVTKTALPNEISEPGDEVTFSVTVQNTGIDPENDVTLNSLIDNVYNDITTTNHDGITATNCVLPQTIDGDGGTYSCSFKAYVDADASVKDGETDTVTATGTDDNGNPVSGSASATVNFLDMLPTVVLTKEVTPPSRPQPGGPFDFTLTVTNTSVEPVDITALTDDNPLSDECLALVDSTLAAAGEEGDSASCTYSVTHTDAGTYENTATVKVQDNEKNEASASDNASVTVTDVPPQASLTKDVIEALVTFEVEICNDSPASTDPLTLDSLSDDVFGDLLDGANEKIPYETNNCLDYADYVIAKDQCITCTFQGMVTTVPHIDTATATVSDDDGFYSLYPSGSAFVDFGIYTTVPE